MKLVVNRLCLLVASIVLFAALGCDSNAKKSTEKPSDLPPPMDPGGAAKDVKGKAPTLPPEKK